MIVPGTQRQGGKSRSCTPPAAPSSHSIDHTSSMSVTHKRIQFYTESPAHSALLRHSPAHACSWTPINERHDFDGPGRRGRRIHSSFIGPVDMLRPVVKKPDVWLTTSRLWPHQTAREPNPKNLAIFRTVSSTLCVTLKNPTTENKISRAQIIIEENLR